MMDFAVSYDGPIAIKYGRGYAYNGLKEFCEPIEYGKSEWIYKGKEVAIIAVGAMVEEAEKLRNMLLDDNISASLINARFISWVDEDMLSEVANNHRLVVTMEENVESGGYGEKVAAKFTEKGYMDKQTLTHINAAIKEKKVEHGKIEVLREKLGIDAKRIYEKIKSYM